MSTKRFGVLSAAAFTTALLCLVGCSNQNITGPTDSAQSFKRQAGSTTAAASSIEIYNRAAFADPNTRILFLISDPTPVKALPEAEVVFKDGTTETPIEFGSIFCGDSVEIRGDMIGDTLFADRIRVRPTEGFSGEYESGGRVIAIDLDNRTISVHNLFVPVEVVEGAEIVSKNSGSETPITLADIAVGDSVDIHGVMLVTGQVVADRVRLRTTGDDFSSALEIKSVITSIDYASGQLTVASRSETITVDDNSFIFTRESMRGPSNRALSGDDHDDDSDNRPKQRISFTDLSVGDSVEVHANIVDPSTLYAVAVELEDGNHLEGMETEFSDVIVTIDPLTGVVTFENHAAGTLVDGAELAGLSNEPVTADSFAPGDIVEVKGFKTAAGFDIVRMHMDNNL